MEFVVIEQHGVPRVCTNYEGEAEIFPYISEAEAYAKEWCQDPLIVKLNRKL